MKHFTLLSLVLALFLTPLQNKAQNFKLETDSVFGAKDFSDDQPTNEIALQTLITNNGTDTLKLSWTKIELDLPDNWKTLVCDNINCYNPTVFTSDFELEPGEEMALIVYVRAEGPNDTALIDVQVQERNGNGIDTVVQFVGASGDKVVSNGKLHQDEQKGVQYYPNPVRETMHVRFPQAGNHQVAIYNALGKVIAQKNTNGSHKLAINLQDKPKGMYFLKYQSEKGKAATRTFSIE